MSNTTTNTYIYKYVESADVTSKINAALRGFIQNTQAPYVLIYNTKTEVPLIDDAKLETLCKEYEAAYSKSKIHYFAGKLTPIKTFDYGSFKLEYGNIAEQKIIVEFLTREAVLKCGYFDVRFVDNCRVGDYIFRLSEKTLYPMMDINKLPGVFDIQTDTYPYPAKHVFDNLSTGWYNYKYKAFPQTKQPQTVETVIESLKTFREKVKQT